MNVLMKQTAKPVHIATVAPVYSITNVDAWRIEESNDAYEFSPKIKTFSYLSKLDLLGKLFGSIERKVIWGLKVENCFSHTFQTIAGLELNADDGVAAH